MAKSTQRSPTDRFTEYEKRQGRLAVVYSRVDAQAPVCSEISLDVQERASCRWARRNSWDIVECIRETGRGSSTDLPGLQRLGQLLGQRRVDVVVANSPDWFAQCQDHLQKLLAQLEEAGASLEFVADGKPQA